MNPSIDIACLVGRAECDSAGAKIRFLSCSRGMQGYKKARHHLVAGQRFLDVHSIILARLRKLISSVVVLQMF